MDLKRKCKALESKCDKSMHVLKINTNEKIKLLEELIALKSKKDSFNFLHFCVFFNFLYTAHFICGLFF